MTGPEIKLRPVSAEDRDLLTRIYAASRQAELDLTPWTEEQKLAFAAHQLGAQTLHYEQRYPAAEHSIILSGDEAAGRIYVHRGDEEIAILDIIVLPEHRSKGIASELIDGLKREAADTGRSVRIYLESFSPSRAFFEKREFLGTAYDDVFMLFRWHAS